MYGKLMTQQEKNCHLKETDRETIPVSMKDCRIQPVRQFLKPAVYCKFKERFV